MTFKILVTIILLIALAYSTYPDELVNLLGRINDFVISLFPNRCGCNSQTTRENLTEVKPDSMTSDDVPSVKSTVDTDNMVNNLAAVDEDLKIPYKYKNATYGDNYFIDDGGDGNIALTSSLCSKSCCTKQYPLPFDLQTDKLVDDKGVEYITTGYTCNNGLFSYYRFSCFNIWKH